MKIARITVRNFRALKNTTLTGRYLTAIVGPNGTGKSTLLHAMDIFCGPATKRISVEDFHNRNVSVPIEVELALDELPTDLTESAGAYVRKDELVVVKTIGQGPKGFSEAYYGYKPVHVVFDNTRRAPKADEMKKQYAALRVITDYSELPAATTMDAIQNALTAWEQAHPDKCELGLDDGMFIGWGNGTVDLARHLRFLLVPAVRDATQDVGVGGTLPTHLQSAYDEGVLRSKPIQDALAAAKEQLLNLAKPHADKRIQELNASMEAAVQEYVPEAKLHVDWGTLELQVTPQRPTVKINEDKFDTDIGRTGHGLQRAIIMAILQQTGALEAASNAGKGMPNRQLVLGIEEPELFQHPSRQRHFAQLLRDAAAGAVGKEKTQVFLATHSPLFVNVDWFDCVRIMRKLPADQGPHSAEATALDADWVAEALWHINGKPGEKWTRDSLRPRLRAVMTPWMNEGFFARKVVLVEGESDRAALLAWASINNVPLDRQGIAVIPVLGKNNLDRPFLVFSNLGIPTYVVWDADYKAPPATNAPAEALAKHAQRQQQAARINRKYCSMMGVAPADFPHGIHKHHAIHRQDLESTLHEEFGDETYQAALDKARQEFDYQDNDSVLKSPDAMAEAIRHAISTGAKPSFLEAVGARILQLDVAHKFVPPPAPV